MVSVSHSAYSDSQIGVWLRGLLTIAWSDGDYDPKEQMLIAEITHDLTSHEEIVVYKSISPEELAEGLGHNSKTAENFLRTAVLVAIADGTYSPQEAEILHQFSNALGLDTEVLECLEHTLCEIPEHQEEGLVSPPHPHPDLLKPLKHWLDDMDIHDPRVARFICKMVPPQCPFERDIKLFYG